MGRAVGVRRAWVGLCAVAAAVFPALASRAAVTSYTSQQQWSAAVGAGTVTTFHFDGPTESDGRAANDPSILPSYSSQGVDFLPFAGTSVYPTILRNQKFQISDPNRDGLLTNGNSPAPVSDLEGRAIRFTFNRPEVAVGTYFNGPYLDGDGGFLRALDASGGVIGETPVAVAGGFVGLVSDRPIARIDVVNTFGPDIRFGIWDLQFSAVPEPAAAGILAVGGLGLFARRRRLGTGSPWRVAPR